MTQCFDCGELLEVDETLEDHQDYCIGDTSTSCDGCGVMLDDADAALNHDCPMDMDDEKEN